MASDKQTFRGSVQGPPSDSRPEQTSRRFRWDVAPPTSTTSQAECRVPSAPPPPALSGRYSPPTFEDDDYGAPSYTTPSSSSSSSSKSSWSSCPEKRSFQSADSTQDESAAKKTKISFGLSKPSSLARNGHSEAEKKISGISIKLGAQKSTATPTALKPKSSKVAAIFNPDEDDEPEEMPPEARMRMRNIGRDTPTSAGPNSFGKTKQGFCDIKKMYEKQLKEAMESAAKEDHYLPE